MARMVKNTDQYHIFSKVVVTFEDGSVVERIIKKDDIVEGLRYVYKEEVKTATGRVANISTNLSKVTGVNVNNPKDYFSKDVVVRTIVVDGSEVYHSNMITVPAREIVENEGEEPVVKVDVVALANVTMDMEYTDGKIVNQDLEIGDVLTDAVIMNGPGNPDITGTFKIVAWSYKAKNTTPVIDGVYLVPFYGGKAFKALFKNFVEFTEADHTDVTNPNSLIDITEALNNSEDGVVFAKLGVDVEVPKRDDGKITTTFIGEGKELNFDLAGHDLTCQAYAFYVNGGTLNISNSSNEGKIIGKYGNSAAYPMVYVNNGGTCNMDSGVIDTTQAEVAEGKENWLYGVVCANDGVFNMTGGEMIIDAASGISITNGTASGEGAKFTIGGNAKITSKNCAAIYLADNKSVTIKDNAVINGGIVARMGDFFIEGNAVVNSHKDEASTFPLGEQVVLSGVGAPKAAFLALTGIYGSSLGNDMNVIISGNAKVNGFIDDAIDIATINTKFDQVVNIDYNSKSVVADAKYRVYDHDELAALAQAAGKTLGAETNTTTLTIKEDGEIIYPVIDEEEVNNG